ncbi:trypsin-like serine protease [Streptomyces montanisoli]|nr:trypsin-like serine protease [Streptomyces montanisoli]
MPMTARAVAAAACLATVAALAAAVPASAAPHHPRASLGPSGPAPAGAHRLGTTAADREMSVALSLKPHDEAGLDAFVKSVSDPSSPNYRHYLTSAQYNERYAPRLSDIADSKAFLKSNGLRVTHVSGNRQVIDAVGTAEQVKAAFGTSIGDYSDAAGKHFYASDKAPTVPAALASTIRAVTGLTDRPAAHRAGHPAGHGKPAGHPAGPTGPGGGYTPAQFRTAYSMNKMSGSYNGSGQKVGLIEFDSFKQSDLDAWTQHYQQPSVDAQVAPVDGGVSSPGSGQLEVTLDVEAVAATAPNAGQVVYEAPNSDNAWVDEMAKIASDDRINILSGSWLLGEKCESSPIKSSHDSYTQMVAQGVTLLSASGDWGATGCGYNGDNSTVQADYPPSDPLFTGVGGTQLRTSDNAGTYQSETCWNQGGTGNTRSGGGYSQIYAKPDWQSGSNGYRSVPDVALDADYGAGAMSVYMNGNWEDVGGTSASSPLWAGYIAMVNQKAKAEGKADLGAMNPTIYAVAKSSQYDSTFNDVTTGDNGTYNAGTGYDLCTGWGSMRGDNLADPLINGATPPAANDFSISADPASVSVDPGKSVTTTVTTKVTKGSAQSVALTASGLPAGVTASFDPASVTAGGSSKLTLTASSSASPGQSSVTVTGKSTDATHNTPVSLTVNGSGQGDFSISVDPSSATVNAGQSATATVHTAAAPQAIHPARGTSAGTTATPAAQPGVVGGTPTSVDTYPFMISLRRDGSVFPGQQSCSMALVGPHTVVGAAHCWLENGGAKWFVYGATDLNDTGFRADIKSVWTDPDYTSWQDGHDVAVYTLDRDVPVPAGIVYPTIATDTSLNAPGTMGKGIGWGETGPQQYSDVLRVVDLPVAADSACAKQPTLSTYWKGDGSMLCTGYSDGHAGVCVGDSGSPFLEGNQIVGFFSWMSNKCDTYGVYTRVTSYADEIKAHLPGSTPPPAGDIALSASGLPSGATATFDPSSVSAGGSSTLTVSTSASTPEGTYKVTVSGKNATAGHDTTFTLNVQGGGTPTPVTVQDPGFQFTQHGTPVSLPMHANGGSGTYTWSATGLPPGLSIDSRTGVISGSAQAGATQIYNVTVTAAESGGGSGKVGFGWFVY